MDDKDDGKGNARKLGTRLVLDNPALLAEKPPRNLVPRKKSLGFIRAKKQHGRIYYYWVRTVYRGKELPPGQDIVMYIGQQLPYGVKLGRVDEDTADKLRKIEAGKNQPKILRAWRK